MLICLLTPIAFAKGVYQKSTQFISNAFNGNIPKPQVIWLTKEDKVIIADIMSHKFKRMRIRYWAEPTQSVWILDEIGKEKPITIGVHIQDQYIKKLKVLTFRESRGDEVRHEFFTQQFDGAQLASNNKLNRHIDGITGATLSVRATTKIARLALWLNNKIRLAEKN